MIVAILVPEVVLYCAWEQWCATRKLRREINQLGEDAFNVREPQSKHLYGDSCDACPDTYAVDGSVHSEASSEYGLDVLFDESNVDAEEGVVGKSRKEEKKMEIWSMEQAFFALSGGFAVDSTTFSPHPRLTLTPSGLLVLAKLGILPNENPDVISDKSKADYVAKVLVCIQAGWFLVQCIARLIQKLPLTLLELHVLAHVLCAFAMYLLWIEKPYDVGTPILCKNEEVEDLAALFALHVDSVS